MKCFNHPDINAIGVCNACSKGLCIECAADLGHGLACKNKHESKVEDIDMIISKNTKIYSSASKNTLIGPIFSLFMGIVFSGFGYFSKTSMTSLTFILGIGFIVFGAIVLVRNRKLFGRDT